MLSAKAERFVRGLNNEIKGFMWAFKEATQTEALCLAVDMGIQGDDIRPKRSDKGTSSRQNRKVDKKPIDVPQRNMRSIGDFPRYQQNSNEVGEAAREKSLYSIYGKHHLGRCLIETKTCFNCK
ncbi:gag-protease polyprotein [Cucumis melo var. makuwa]|uniref:Gag-protease polyprotein n=1 Tax=Cucumis melo var. makuwa TaxID=1194695 RepID=A0A5A7TQU0_CUCMM|nr:gag-protease polyprotein [Cucumis melo var. makuwa]